jgi:UDP-N-acetylmuramyl pentapeptide phosphotransferase/UDP-N-acetylglucosamine-1-phosphate transferase
MLNSIPVESRIVLGLLTGLLVSLVIIPPIVRVSVAKNLGSLPNGRTSHKGSIPPLGGVAIFASVVLGICLFTDSTGFDELRYILGGILLVFLIGLKDDLVSLRWKKKLIIEILAASIVVLLGDVRIQTFHGLFGIWEISYVFSICFSIFVIVAIMNCFNLIDGIDGLASGLGIAISAIFGFWLYSLGFLNFAVLAFVLTGGLMSFYVYNVFGKKNKIFMGDTGSLLLGFILAVLAIKVMCCEVPQADILYLKSLPTVVMGLMIIPILDTLRVFFNRIGHGKSPFTADRTHLHHIFLNLGNSHFKASSIIILINLSLFCIAILMSGMDATVSAVLLFVTALVIIEIPCYLAKQRHLPESGGNLPNFAD